MAEIMKLKSATPDVKEIVQQVIKDHYATVNPTRILIAMSVKPMMHKGRSVWANIAVASAPVNLSFAMGCGLDMSSGLERQLDYVLTVHIGTWEKLSPEDRYTLIDHELHHIEYSEEGKPKTTGHDFEEFVDIVERHGPWTPALKAAQEAAKKEKA